MGSSAGREVCVVVLEWWGGGSGMEPLGEVVISMRVIARARGRTVAPLATVK